MSTLLAAIATTPTFAQALTGLSGSNVSAVPVISRSPRQVAADARVSPEQVERGQAAARLGREEPSLVGAVELVILRPEGISCRSVQVVSAKPLNVTWAGAFNLTNGH